MPALVLKVPEVAELLQCGPRSVYRLIENGELRSVNVGRLIRIPEQAVHEFLAGQEEPPAPKNAEGSVVPIHDSTRERPYGG